MVVLLVLLLSIGLPWWLVRRLRARGWARWQAAAIAVVALPVALLIWIALDVMMLNDARGQARREMVGYGIGFVIMIGIVGALSVGAEAVWTHWRGRGGGRGRGRSNSK